MSNFYARYIPPTKKTDATTESAAQLSGSTKRKLQEQDLALREPKKPRPASIAELKKDDFGVKRFIPKAKRPGSDQEARPIIRTTPALLESQQTPPAGQDVLDKYRVTGAAKKSNAEAEVQIRRPAPMGASNTQTQNPTELASAPKPKKIKKKRRERPDDTENVPETTNGTPHANDKASKDGFEKHTSVRDRFKKAKKKSEQHQSAETAGAIQDTPKPELHGLEPLPQPPEVEILYEPPSYSTLPPWLAKADHVSQKAEVTFASLGLSATVLSKLKDKGLERTLPIQSAVLPLLSEGSMGHDGDLAVAAATGSGKTLAYVLPIVEALKDLAVTKLRGVIVVPTRELVKQVQETFNMCSEGENLRAAIALGSKSVKEEAEALVESYEVYDPETYAEQQSQMIDWAEFSLLELFERAKDGTRQAPNHVTRYRSKVDVLICTPGRLVEHLQTTKGFSLDDVRWLVIDEVDRLLNESYQEWIEVVTPALQSGGATIMRDTVLQKMSLEIPPRQIRKIILSATMTQDLSKLNSLNLRNPRLLVLDGERSQDKAGAREEAAEPTRDASGAFQLPSTLMETVVMVGDGANKPLHLLELLQTRIVTVEKPLTNGTTAHNSDASSSDSSDETSSSDSSSTSSTTSTPTQSNTTKPAQKRTPYPSTLIFTHSTSAAPRLARLLTLLHPSLTSTTAVLTRSTASSASSRRALKAFRGGTITILITTDRASRGLDIPNIEHVINYDVPGSVEAYVHRVGRTARAGKVGRAWTLVEHRQGRWFEAEIAKGRLERKERVRKITLDEVGKGEIMTRYEEALKKLGEEVEGG